MYPLINFYKLLIFNLRFSIYPLPNFYKLEMFQELNWRQLEHVSCWITVLEGLSAFTFYCFNFNFFIVITPFLTQNVFLHLVKKKDQNVNR